MTWQDRAACKGQTHLFFPKIPDETAEDGEQMDDGTIWEAYGDTSEFYSEALALCSTCPVQVQCLAASLVERERWGMWGGLTPIERRRIERTERRRRLKERRAAEES